MPGRATITACFVSRFNRWRRAWFALGVGCVFASFVMPSAAAVPERFVIDMVHHNPGEMPPTTAFSDPQFLQSWGYNGQVIMAEADSCETFDALTPDLFPTNGEERVWIEQHAKNLEQRARETHAAGIQAYAWFQCIVLPRKLVARFKGQICDSLGRIDLERPMTQTIIRAQLAELFARCPSLDGIVVRTGEIYLQDSPYHTSSGNLNESLTQGATAIIHGPDSHIALLKLLRDEACVKRDKVVIYRTWDFGDNFHSNPTYYLKVTGAIEPHPDLIFSIKHQAGDFLRMIKFNPTLGIGRHKQIVEVQCQREYYGKGAHPYYVGDGVINGWEEYDTMMKPGESKGLRDLVNNTNFAGVWTWSRGGGWDGPRITNEFWCALNAYVIAKFAENPKRTEADIFAEYAREQLHLSGKDIARFRELNLLSAAAIVRGQCSLIGNVDRFWARDDTMSAPDLSNFITNGLVKNALAEKAEAVTDWEKIVKLAHQIRFADPATQEFVETSCAYGLIKYQIFEQAWTILIYGQMGDATRNYDRRKISQAITAYDALWVQWRALKAQHPSCATLANDRARGDLPGTGAAVERYRQICAAKN